MLYIGNSMLPAALSRPPISVTISFVIINYFVLTIKYLEMVVEIYPYFQHDKIPGFGKENCGFSRLILSQYFP